MAIVLIARKLADVRALADRVSVFRGSIVPGAASKTSADTTDAALIEAVDGPSSCRRSDRGRRLTSKEGAPDAERDPKIDVTDEHGHVATTPSSVQLRVRTGQGRRYPRRFGQRPVTSPKPLLGLRRLVTGHARGAGPRPPPRPPPRAALSTGPLDL